MAIIRSLFGDQTEKAWYQSKTIAFAALAIAVGAETIFGYAMPEQVDIQVVGAVVSVIGAVFGVLRLMTRQPVGLAKPISEASYRAAHHCKGRHFVLADEVAALRSYRGQLLCRPSCTPQSVVDVERTPLPTTKVRIRMRPDHDRHQDSARLRTAGLECP